MPKAQFVKQKSMSSKNLCSFSSPSLFQTHLLFLLPQIMRSLGVVMHLTLLDTAIHLLAAQGSQLVMTFACFRTYAVASETEGIIASWYNNISLYLYVNASMGLTFHNTNYNNINSSHHPEFSSTQCFYRDWPNTWFQDSRTRSSAFFLFN